MDRDTFIITVYCLVVEAYKTVNEKYKIRRGGFPPAVTDEEVITMEICGVYFKLHQDKDLFDYFPTTFTAIIEISFPLCESVLYLFVKPPTCGKSKPPSGG